MSRSLGFGFIGAGAIAHFHARAVAASNGGRLVGVVSRTRASAEKFAAEHGIGFMKRGELLRLRNQGCALLVFSEELDELFELCDRLHVIADGRLSPSVPIAQATREQIGEWMSGLWPTTANTEAADVQA